VKVQRKTHIDGAMNKADAPLVSVICLCYNHSKYVVEAINSVLEQTYPNVELLVIDDASTDNSKAVIREHIKSFEHIKFIELDKNVGNCTAFNIGWRASSGAYVIDLAADDVLLPERISVGIEYFLKLGSDYGVHFTDARLIDKSGNKVGEHLTSGYFDEKVPEGFIFNSILQKYFINPASMMYSVALLNYLGGYDESLANEDFDLWVRSSKKFKYCYSKQILVAKRLLNKSYSRSQYRPGSAILRSTFVVCEKAFNLCENNRDFESLLIRINYEMKMAFISFNWLVALKFYQLKKQTIRKINAVES